MLSLALRFSRFTLCSLLSWLLAADFLCADALKPFPADTAQALQHALETGAAIAGYPGISCAISVPGYEIWNGTYGDSETSPRRAVTSNMAFGMGSVSKSFAAALVMQLVEDGKLSLDDRIGDYLPPLRNVDPAVTIEEALGMTSGIFNYVNATPAPWSFIGADPFHVWEPEEVLDSFVEESVFTHGTDYSYSNTNYLLLGLIIESVTGKAYETVLRERILEPNGLEQIWMGGLEPARQVYAGTDFNGDGIINRSSDRAFTSYLSFFWAAGGLVCTPEELTRWGQALFGGKIVSQESLDSMLAFGEKNRVSWYGLGVTAASIDGHVFYGHSGWVSYVSSLRFSRDTGVTMALMGNDDYVWSHENTDPWQPDTLLVKAMKANRFDRAISFEPIAYALSGDAPIELMASSENSPFEAISYEVLSGPGAIEDGRFAASGNGTVTLRAYQNENDFYKSCEAVREIAIYDRLGDEDGDGVSNILERAFAMSLRERDAGELPQLRFEGGEVKLRFVYGREDVRYVLERTSDFEHWETLELPREDGVCEGAWPMVGVYGNGWIYRFRVFDEAM